MKVRDVMTHKVYSCRPDSNLGEAAKIMWDYDCGSVPVVNQNGTVIGMVTDRDLCMALTTTNRRALDMTVWEVLSARLTACAPDACAPDDEIDVALNTMAAGKIRRLPVIDSDGRLQGMLSVNDLIRHAREGTSNRPSGLSYADVMHTLKAISAHRALAKA